MKRKRLWMVMSLVALALVAGIVLSVHPIDDVDWLPAWIQEGRLVRKVSKSGPVIPFASGASLTPGAVDASVVTEYEWQVLQKQPEVERLARADLLPADGWNEVRYRETLPYWFRRLPDSYQTVWFGEDGSRVIVTLQTIRRPNWLEKVKRWFRNMGVPSSPQETK
jgi:hypothetical protein